MHPETLQLEKLRQQIEDVEYEWGSLGDYLDRGKPNAAEQKKAQENIEKLKTQSGQLKAKLHELALATRSDKPDAFEEWVKVHKDMLTQILNEDAKDKDVKVRKHVATGTLAEWDQVLAGEKEYVGINWYFLKAYKENVRKVFRGDKINTTTTGDQKSWWQFWK